MEKTWAGRCCLLALAIMIAYYRLWELAGLSGLILILHGLWRNQASRQTLNGLILFAVFLLFAGLILKPAPLLDSSPGNATFSGTVLSRPRIKADNCSFVFEPDQPRLYQENIQVFCRFPAGVEKNQRLTLKGVLRPPDPPGNPGEFDYKTYLANEKIYYLLSVKDPEDLQPIGSKGSWLGFLEGYRRESIALIQQALEPETAGILIGILFGDTSGIDEEEYEEYQKTGIIHIFSVSGMHIGFLALLCSWILVRLKAPPPVVLLCSLGVLLIYATMVDWPAPVQRSVLMAALGLIAHHSGRDRDLLNSLGLSGCIILALEPRALFQISFQLSFLAAWGLVYLFPRLKILLNLKHPVFDLLLVPLAAQAAVLPLIAYYFNILSPVSLLANLLLAYISELVVMLGFLFLMVGVVMTPAGLVLLEMAEVLIELTRLGNHLLVQLPGAYLWVATPAAAVTCAYYAGILAALQTRRTWLRKWGLILIAGFFIWLAIPASFFNRGQTELVFLDVGQGDCILIKTPVGEFILIDGGGSNLGDVGRRKVLPYLRFRGIRELKLAINTHPDIDHLAGLSTVLEEIPAETVAIPLSLARDKAYDRLKAVLETKGTPLIGLHDGQSIDEGPFQLKVVGAENMGGESNSNRNSLVLELKTPDFSALLTGDLDRAALEELYLRGAFRPVSVLKLPHHGSKNSLYPGLYQATCPHYGVISLGVRNIFGHPSPLVLQALQEEGINILRTDVHGAVAFISGAEGCRIFLGPGQKEYQE